MNPNNADNPKKSDPNNADNPKKPESEVRKIKVVIVADSHGRELQSHVQAELGSQYQVLVVTCTNAPFNYVARNLVDFTRDFTLADHAVIIAGTNNVPDLVTIDAFHSFNLSAISIVSQRTNVIFVNVPERFDNRYMNELIHNLNTSLRGSLEDIPRCTFLDTTRLTAREYTRHGLHLNRRGKAILAKLIADIIKRR